VIPIIPVTKWRVRPYLLTVRVLEQETETP
jgi:hypothetical protein